MRDPNKTKMAGGNSRFAIISEAEILKIQEGAIPEISKFLAQDNDFPAF